MHSVIHTKPKNKHSNSESKLSHHESIFNSSPVKSLSKHYHFKSMFSGYTSVLLASLILAPSILSSVPALATTSDSQNLSFSVVVSEVPFLQLTLETNNLSLDLTPKATSSDFKSSTFWTKVTTTNTTGYNLTMKASSSSLSSGTSTIPTIVDNSTIYPNGKACTGETVSSTTNCPFDNNSWGYRLPDDTGYFAVPTGASSKTIGSSTIPVDEEENSIVFAAKVDHTVPAGTYNTNIEFQATANVTYICDAGKICYDDNGANSPTTMADQSTDDSGDTIDNTTLTNSHTVTLWASNFQRPGYGFLGWNTDKDGNGTMYGPNQTLTDTEVNSLLSSGKQLYAIWLKASSQYTMQTFTDTICKTQMTQVVFSNGIASYNDNAFIALRDERDDNTYAVARLADGNCWMMENLRLGSEATLTATNTHNPALPLIQSDGTTTANHLSTTSNDWCTTSTVACHDESLLNTAAITNTISESTGNSATDSYAANIYSYGNYYNWYSATAGNGKHDTVNGETLIQNTNTAGDICPANWRLPAGGAFPNTTMKDTNGSNGAEATDNTANSDFYKLFHGMLGVAPNLVGPTSKYTTYYGDVATTNAYQSASTIGTTASQLARMYPNNFIYSGYHWGTSATQRGIGGGYTSSTVYRVASAYGLYFDSAALYPGTNSHSKSGGFLVRCLAGN